MIGRILENLMLRVMKGYSYDTPYRAYNKRNKTMMKSINMITDDTILEKDIDDDGKGINLKTNEDDDNISVEGKILIFSNRIWGSRVETRRWALEIKPKGFQCCVSPPKQEIEPAP